MNPQIDLFRFDGVTFNSELDSKRLSTQLGQVYLLMRDGRWRSLHEMTQSVRGSESAISARLRDFRKERFAKEFGVISIMRRRVEDSGLWQYRMIAAR